MKNIKIKLKMGDVDLKMAEKVSKEITEGVRKVLTEEDLQDGLRSAFLEFLSASETIENDINAWKDESKLLLQYSANTSLNSITELEKHLRENPPTAGAIAYLIILVERLLNSKRAKHAADKKHNKPGGSRDRAEKIKKLWASGKYSSRDICAEQESAALDMSFSAARKALRNTPDPT